MSHTSLAMARQIRRTVTVIQVYVFGTRMTPKKHAGDLLMDQLLS
ncbi:hypothetical protein [Enteractinococcus coprophilus]|nr:hypothetical protein [Enteractinococcus coprophilus]